MRNLRKLAAFVALGADEVCDEFFGENTACCKVIVVGFESVERLIKRGRKML